MIIKTTCQKCGTTIRLDFGGLSKEDAERIAHQMDNTPRECPGQHAELSGMARLWAVHEAIHRAYDLGESEQPQPIISDHEYVSQLIAEGKEILDGGTNTTPELHLKSIHEYKSLEHTGFGNFTNETHIFLRCDSPRGTRIYQLVPRNT